MAVVFPAPAGAIASCSRAPEVQRVGGARTVAERDDQLAGFAHLVPPSHHRAALGVRMALEIDTLQAALAACRDAGCGVVRPVRFVEAHRS
jgi:hypothetical protein